MRILIAEDDSASRNILKILLEKHGHDVVVTEDGAQAWQAMQQPDSPKLAILDWRMPFMDGVDVCRNIRKQETDQPPYIIMLTANDKKDGIVTGLFAGADDYMAKPFDFTELLARLGVGIRMVELHAKLMEARNRADEALEAAGIVQQSLLPKQLPDLDQVESAWKFTPCDAVGGDIFNIVPLDANHIGVYMVDVAGHGPASAMVSVLVYQLMNSHSGILIDHAVNPPHIREPEEVLNLLDREFPLRRFNRHFTMVYAILNVASGALTYSNAAHCAPILLSQGSDLKVLTVSGTVIGVGEMPFGQETVDLNPGDTVVLLSDGLEEMGNGGDELFGQDRLHRKLRALRGASPAELVQGVYDEAMLFAGGNPAADDLSILALEYKG